MLPAAREDGVSLTGMLDPPRPEVREAVARGDVTVSFALKLKHLTEDEQRAALNADPGEDKTKIRRPSYRKIEKVLQVDKLPKQVRVAIEWATGAITDEEAAEHIKALQRLLEPSDDPDQMRFFE